MLDISPKNFECRSQYLNTLLQYFMFKDYQLPIAYQHQKNFFLFIHYIDVNIHLKAKVLFVSSHRGHVQRYNSLVHIHVFQSHGFLLINDVVKMRPYFIEANVVPSLYAITLNFLGKK